MKQKDMTQYYHIFNFNTVVGRLSYAINTGIWYFKHHYELVTSRISSLLKKKKEKKKENKLLDLDPSQVINLGHGLFGFASYQFRTESALALETCTCGSKGLQQNNCRKH